MVQMFTIIATALAVVLASSQTSAQAQSSCLYSGKESTGEYICYSQTYVPHLQNNNFDNKANSFCATGIYLFYDYPNYNDGVNAQMEYVFGPNNYCGDFKNLAGKASSVRFAGDPKNYRTDSLTLYHGSYFQGEEEYLLGNTPNLNIGSTASSFILTGSQPFTLYDQPNYLGNSVCIYPPKSDNWTPALIWDTNSVSVPNGTIRSVRKGCFGMRQVFTEASTRGVLNTTSAGAPIPFAPDFDPAPINLKTAPVRKLA